MAEAIRVLIVDDIPETRDHLTKLLGFESDIEVVGAAASGSEAIDLATSLHPDIVLMDINMPDMDGIAATEHLATRVPTAVEPKATPSGFARAASTMSRAVLNGESGFTISAIWFSKVWQIGTKDLSLYPTLLCIYGSTE